jgi:hypothetical protein
MSKHRLIWGRPEFGIPPGVAKFGFFAGLVAAVVLLALPLLAGR